MGRRTGTHLDGLSHLFVTVAVWALDKFASLENRTHSAADGLLLFSILLFHLDVHGPCRSKVRHLQVAAILHQVLAACIGAAPMTSIATRAVHSSFEGAAAFAFAATPEFLTAGLLEPAAVLAVVACWTTGAGFATRAALALAQQGVGEIFARKLLGRLPFVVEPLAATQKRCRGLRRVLSMLTQTHCRRAGGDTNYHAQQDWPARRGGSLTGCSLRPRQSGWTAAWLLARTACRARPQLQWAASTV